MKLLSPIGKGLDRDAYRARGIRLFQSLEDFAPAPVDPDFLKTGLLITGNSLLDQSAQANAILPVSGGTLTTELGEPALKVSGASQVYSTCPEFQLGTADWCIEFRFRYTGTLGSDIRIVYPNSYTPGIFAIASRISGGRKIGLLAEGQAWVFEVPWNAPPDTWMHLAFTRQGSVHRIFMDGVLLGTYIDSRSWSFFGADLKFHPQGTAAWFRDIRWTKGAARYTANFQPPSSPLPVQVVTPEPELTALLALQGGVYSSARQRKMSAVIRGLKDAGVWALLDQIAFPGPTEADSLRNWVNPAQVASNFGMAFSANNGWQNNGASYINSNITLSTAQRYSLNSGHLALSVLSGGTEVSIDMGCYHTSSGQAWMSVAWGSTFQGRLNNATSGPGHNLGSPLGHSLINRLNSNYVAIYRNGSGIVGNGATPAQVVPNRPPFIGANNAGFPEIPSSRRYSSWSIGAGLSDPQIQQLWLAKRGYDAYLAAL